jgi:hypothetical protein
MAAAMCREPTIDEVITQVQRGSADWQLLGRFDPFATPPGNGRFLRILLKNSNFRLYHDSEDRWQSRWKFP